jgi:hypothetical protein
MKVKLFQKFGHNSEYIMCLLYNQPAAVEQTKPQIERCDNVQPGCRTDNSGAIVGGGGGTQRNEPHFVTSYAKKLI